MFARQPPSSSLVSRNKYDVFLSFRGEDTRKNFTDHLYDALTRSGVVTFRDDKNLEAGQEIGPELCKAIQESWCSIIVFSQTYIFSSWCLDELVEITQQKYTKGHKIFPIFYDVDPSDLKKQTGKVREAFLMHEERYKENKDKTQKWRCALIEVCSLSGWHLNNRHESEFIRDIVKKISTKLCQIDSSLSNELVGMNSRLEELHFKMNFGEDDVRIVGICGMGGIGKTTLASVIYTQMSSHFESKSFLADVREVSEKRGIVFLQKQLLSQTLSEEESLKFLNVHEGNIVISRRLIHKKVLVVVDDVDNIQQLKCLIGSRGWFGLGSRIIVTTRDEHLLRSYHVDDVYMPMTLNHKEAFHLFSLKAFGSAFIPDNDFIKLSECVIEYASGLPLALEVLGSFLYGRNVSQWKSAIERLKIDFHKGIHERLQISFDGLEETEKNIFLDIACFFQGENKDFVTKILDGCNFFSYIGIDVLIKKCLLTVNEFNELRMHDLLQEMGRKIVKKKSLDESGRRCRLWEESDVYHVLTKNTATDRVEGMVIDYKPNQVEAYNWGKKMILSAQGLSKMKNLRLLRVFRLPISRNLAYLSNELRLFEWHGYPLKSFPSSFQPENLVALFIPYSGIKQLWTENRPFNNLKFINLKGCQNLIKFVDFKITPYLESLILDGCIKIKELGSSIGQLSNLALLSLKDCTSLLGIPNNVGKLKSLKTLNLSGCSKIENLPQSLQQVESLETLDLSSTAIREPQSFVFQFKNLKFLSLEGCNGVPSQLQANLLSIFKMKQGRNKYSLALMLPPLSGLSSLTKLNLSDCNLEEGAIPSDICRLSSLKYLDISCNNFISLPATLSRLSHLAALLLSNCKLLKSLLNLQTRYLQIDGCTSLETIGNVTSTCMPMKESIFIDGFNCYRLVEDDKAVALLKRHLKVFVKKRLTFGIAIPGSEIPEWFKRDYHSRFDYNESYSVKIPLPPNIQNDSEWVGVALCLGMEPIFGDDTMGKNESVHIYPTNRRKNGHEFEWDLPNIKCAAINHLRLHYLLPDIFYPFLLGDKGLGDGIEISIEKLAFDNLLPNDMEFSLKKLIVDNGLPMMRKYGIRLLFEKDFENQD